MKTKKQTPACSHCSDTHVMQIGYEAAFEVGYKGLGAGELRKLQRTRRADLFVAAESARRVAK